MPTPPAKTAGGRVSPITVRTRVASESRLSEELRENSAFGAVYSDHMFLADYIDGEWQSPEILPYGPLPSPPAPSAVHYGQAIFEGFKAFRMRDERVGLFRPRENWLRLNRSAARLAMPAIPEKIFIDGVKELVSMDRDWVPYREGGSLYIRPVYFATD